MPELAHAIGRLRARLCREGIPNRTALSAALLKLRRILEDARVPEWLVLELLAPCDRRDVIDARDSVAVFWKRFLRSVRCAVDRGRAGPLNLMNKTAPVVLNWVTGPLPLGLAEQLRHRIPNPVLSLAVEAKAPETVAERLLVVQARIAIDAIPTILKIGELRPLTGLVLVGAGNLAEDATPLVLGPATGVAIELLAEDIHGNGLREADADTILRLLFGPLALPPARSSPDAPILVRLFDLFDRMIRDGTVRSAVQQLSWSSPLRTDGDVERIVYEVTRTHAVLRAMTEEEREDPRRLKPGRRAAIAAVSKTTVRFVIWLIEHYTGR